MILVDKENIVISLEKIEEVADGFIDVVNHILYPKYLDAIWYKNVTAPEYVKPYKYKYVDGNFIVNENYQEPFDLEKTVMEQEKIIDKLLVDSLMGV
ncbi:hypothetical protein [Vallitalea guaymasensis]|uniref:hypothetical protein n=1 Tax=Vallitalea guaymasensis TaxID=1185412 RepID=UPI000DE4508B|nr:hypothetical protein [Vallitalea guaymasensis]